MPTVPSVTAPSVMPTASGGIPYQNANGATPDAFGAGIGDAMTRQGAALDQFGGVLASHAEKMQADVNASAAKDMFLQADTALGKLQVDYNSLEGANRVNAYPKYVEDIGKLREDMIKSAPNDATAKLFDQDFTRRVGYSIVDGARSAATANKQYQHQTNEAVRTNSLQHIAANAQDDQRFKTELDIGKQTFQNSDEYKGASPEVRAQRDQAFVSSAWSTRLQAMTRTDPLRARELLNKNKDSIDGITQVKLEESINQGIINVQSRVDSDRIVQSGALIPQDFQDRVKKLEGYSDKPYSDYKQTSIGYGTRAQPGDEALSPEERKSVLEQRFKSELGRAANIVDQFAPGLPKGTREAMISLTYNAGSAWTTQGLGQKIKAGDLEGAKENFAQYNQAGGAVNPGLVSRRQTELSWWGGEPTNTDNDTSLDRAMTAAREKAAEIFPNDPGNQAKYADTLQSRIRADYGLMHSAAREIQLNLKNTVQAELFRPDNPPTSYDQLSPAARQAYDNSPPSLQQSFQKSFRSNATRDVPYTAERRSLGDQLYGEAANEPEKFMSRDINSLDLTRVQKSDFLRLQSNKKATLEKGVKLNTAMAAIQPLLNDAGIGKSATDSSKNAEYNKFSGVMSNWLDQFIGEHKRPPTDKEIREQGAVLLKDVVTSPGFLWNSKDRAYSVIADKTPIQFVGEPAQFNEHYATIPRGATYIAPDGSTRVKK